MIRVRRRAIDHVLSIVIPVHRFRCSSPECGHARNFHMTKSAVALRGASRPSLGALLVMLLGALVLVKVFQAMSDQGLPRQSPGPVNAKSLGYLAESKGSDVQEVCQNAFPSAPLSANPLECFPVDALADTMSASNDTRLPDGPMPAIGGADGLNMGTPNDGHSSAAAVRALAGPPP